jgi:hypothetical protein
VEQASLEEQPAATQDMAGSPAVDRCADCHAPLAPDQRYCVNCGERRGQARFSFEALVAPAPAPPPARRRRLQVSSSFSFIAGVATLLLALGVGVLIGHNGNSTRPLAAPSQVIKIEGGIGGNATTPAASSKNFTAPQVHLTPKVIKKVQQAAAKVLGSGAANLSQNVTQQVGQSCGGGNGCQGHKFTGNFFGGG